MTKAELQHLAEEAGLAFKAKCYGEDRRKQR